MMIKRVPIKNAQVISNLIVSSSLSLFLCLSLPSCSCSGRSAPLAVFLWREMTHYLLVSYGRLRLQLIFLPPFPAASLGR